MRIYANCYELMSEIFREVFEMGHIVHPNSMQNKDVTNDDEYTTKEITNYSYSLTSLNKVDNLFYADRSAKEWANAEFLERVMNPVRFQNPGEAYKLRSHIWDEFLNSEGKFDYTYNERISKSLYFVLDELKRNPDTRQAIIPIFKPSDAKNVGGKKRIPCSIYYDFQIRRGRLNIVYHQRSADVVTHFGNDVYLAWKLMEWVANKVDVKQGYLFHNIDSLHAYKKDWPTLKQCIDDIRV